MNNSTEPLKHSGISLRVSYMPPSCSLLFWASILRRLQIQLPVNAIFLWAIIQQGPWVNGLREGIPVKCENIWGDNHIFFFFLCVFSARSHPRSAQEGWRLSQEWQRLWWGRSARSYLSVWSRALSMMKSPWIGIGVELVLSGFHPTWPGKRQYRWGSPKWPLWELKTKEFIMISLSNETEQNLNTLVISDCHLLTCPCVSIGENLQDNKWKLSGLIYDYFNQMLHLNFKYFGLQLVSPYSIYFKSDFELSLANTRLVWMIKV